MGTARLLNEDLEAWITRAVLRLGHDCDGQSCSKSAASSLFTIRGMVQDQRHREHTLEFDLPYILAEGPHWFALYKPPFWNCWEGSGNSREVAWAADKATPFEDENDADAG